jgi:hypothetical protein
VLRDGCSCGDECEGAKRASEGKHISQATCGPDEREEVEWVLCLNVNAMFIPQLKLLLSFSQTVLKNILTK